jgi:predicted phage terminase large subunit-like protein
MTTKGIRNWALIKKRLRIDRRFFFEFLLSHYMKSHTVGELHNEWFNLLSTENKFGAVAPRGHAKSTIINIADNLFDICNGYEPYIVIFSDTPEQATEHLGAIVEELEGNELIHEFYGHLYEARKVGEMNKEKWTQSVIITKNGVKVEAKGWRSKTRGMRWKENRPSKIVIDDIENDEDVNSPLMRLKLRNIFEKRILNLGEPETKYRFIGTVLHYDSLLMNEYKNPRPNWCWKFYDALKSLGGSYADVDTMSGTPLWPEWWSLERLKAKKDEIGSIPFNQEFRNNPLDSTSQVLKPKEFYESVDLTMVECFGYIDLAISEKETADYTAVVTIGRHKVDGRLYVIEPIQFRGSVTEQLARVFELHKRYKYKSFGVESVAYQKAFAQLVREYSNRTGEYIPVVEVEIDKDKVRRAIEITPYIENGTILFNASYQDFMAQVVQFPKADHDDMVDALVGAVNQALKGISSGYTISTSGSSIYPQNV